MLDPMQLAYKPHKGVDDATITLLNLTVKHLEGNTSHGFMVSYFLLSFL